MSDSDEDDGQSVLDKLTVPPPALRRAWTLSGKHIVVRDTQHKPLTIELPAFAVRFRPDPENAVLHAPTTMCLGCAEPGCCHGWPRIRPQNIWVVTTRSNMQPVYGWFVCVDARPNTLMRIPATRMIALVQAVGFTAHERLLLQRLMAQYRDVTLLDEDERDFEVLLELRLDQQREVLRAEKQARKRKRPATRSTPEATTPLPREDETCKPGVCVVCFGDDAGPCYTRTCCGNAGAICATCRSQLRGLCVLCDREYLNQRIPCACCGVRVGLAHSGYACGSCGAQSLCSACYHEYECCFGCDLIKLGH